MHKDRIIRFLALGLLFAVLYLAAPQPAAAQVGVFVTFGPPDIPVYDQPICPADGYMWVPGYWAWDPDAGDYYWVPGTWIVAPEPGFLWTPGYWGWGASGFFWTEGYWGPVVGFYGGIDYGFGYFGSGFVGGRWEGGHFFYNRAVLNVNVTVIHNVYETRVEHENVTRVSYNGGRGGITARPSAAEEAAARERHVGPVAEQTRHIEAARANPDFRSKVNNGRPAVAATAKPGEFKGGGVVAARSGGALHNEGGARPETGGARPEGGNKTITHPKDIPAGERPPKPNTGNASLDKKYQQQQDKLAQQQERERQQLQTKQDAEHAKAQQQKASDAKQQQMEQRHSQQTQKLQQRQTQQTQRMTQQQSHSNPPRK